MLPMVGTEVVVGITVVVVQIQAIIQVGMAQTVMEVEGPGVTPVAVEGLLVEEMTLVPVVEMGAMTVGVVRTEARTQAVRIMAVLMEETQVADPIVEAQVKTPEEMARLMVVAVRMAQAIPGERVQVT